MNNQLHIINTILPIEVMIAALMSILITKSAGEKSVPIMKLFDAGIKAIDSS